MNWIQEYYKKIKQEPKTTGKWIYKTMEYLLDGYQCHDFFYNPKKAQHAIDFIENFCRHTKGKNTLIKLEPWQKAMIAGIFGSVDGEDYRQFFETIILQGRKNGKTLIASAIALYMLVATKEYGVEAYCIAPKLRQSELTYSNVIQMIKNDEDLSSIAVKRRSDVYIPATNSYIMPLAFNSDKSDGFNPYIVICDEIASWQGAAGLKMYEVINSGRGARKEPLILSISTAGYSQGGIYDELLTRSTAVLNGASKEKRLLPFLFMIDDIDKCYDLDELKKANPNMGVSVREEFFLDEIEIAKVSKSKRSEFLTKYCNIKQNSSVAWLNFEEVKETQTDLTIEDFKGHYAVIGVDLSQTTDLSCVTIAIEKDKKIYLFAKFFMPEKRFEKGETEDKVPYKIYQEKGFIESCGEGYIEPEIIGKRIMEIVDQYDLHILKVGYDRYTARHLVSILEESGFQTDDVHQGENLTPIIKEFYGLLLEGRIKILNNNELLKIHFLNVALKHNEATRKFRPIKIAPSMRIDGFVSTIDALTVRDKYRDEIGLYLENNK